MAAQELKTFSDIYTAVINELKEQAADTAVLDRVKRIINMVYLDEVVPSEQWMWLRGSKNLTLPKVIEDGTLAVTESSTSITFSSAPTQSYKGALISVQGDSEVYRIAAHTAGATTAELETVYVESTATAASYKLWREKIAVPPEVREIFSLSTNHGVNTLEGAGFKKYRRLQQQNPLAESRPRYFSLGDYVDPDPYASISGLPALSTRASSGTVKTLIFASDVSSYLEVGNRVEVSAAGDSSYNGEAIISSVSTTTVTYTGDTRYNETATADATLVIKKITDETAEERHRELYLYPSIYTKDVNLIADYIKEPPPLEDDADEPLMPISDRIVLYYGALALAWNSLRRDPEQAKLNERRYVSRLARMTGKVTESTDFPRIVPDKSYLAAKRGRYRWLKWWSRD